MKLFALILIHLGCLVTMNWAQAYEPNDIANFLSLSDIHFDPFIACDKQTPCPLILQLQQASAQNWKNILARMDVSPPRYRQDTNYPLLRSTLQASKAIAQQQSVQFVLILGDFLGHDYRNNYRYFSGDKTRAGYQQFARKTFEFLYLELKTTFPGTDVFPVVGNNDSLQGDYYTQPRYPMFTNLAQIWSTGHDSGIQSRMQKQMLEGGYYAVDVPRNPRLRVIALNTNFFSVKARGKNVAEGARAQLDWLANELALTQQQKQKAIIAMHIPMGIDIYATLHIRLFKIIDLWEPQYIDEFQLLLKNYSDSIMGIFSGHLHTPWFQLMAYSPSSIPVNGIPSISPIFGSNPAFKLFRYYPQSLTIKNFTTFYSPIDESSQWLSNLNYPHVYLRSCRYCPLTFGMNRLRTV